MIDVSSSPVAVAVNCTIQYEVSLAVTPIGTGSTSPTGTGNWVSTGSEISVTAMANNGYDFQFWTTDTPSL
jgi:hypothetical protein